MSIPQTEPTPADEVSEKTKPQSSPRVGDKSTIPQFGAATPTGENLPLPTIPGYAIESLIGAGGMGAVYAAVDLNLRRKVAIKVMLPSTAVIPTARERFQREARSAAAVEHENVATIYHVGEADGQPFLVMPLLKGRPLNKVLQESGRPSVAEAVRIGRETAAGLAAAHASGLIHRDIKPSNIWIDEASGRVRILDFGLAKPLESTEGFHSKSGEVMGTPAYMAPEQAAGHPVDARTDLFSLGVVLYELLTGTLPFHGPNILAMLTALATKDPPSVRSLNPNVPNALDKLVQSLLAKEPMRRPLSARDVETALAGIQQGGGSSYRTVGMRESAAAAPEPAPAPQPRPVAPPAPAEPAAPPPWAQTSPSPAPAAEPVPPWLTHEGHSKPRAPVPGSAPVNPSHTHRPLPAADGHSSWRQLPTPSAVGSNGNLTVIVVVAIAAVLVIAFFVVLLTRS